MDRAGPDGRAERRRTGGCSYYRPNGVSVVIDYTDRTVLVTGGTKGIGRGIAARFADAGADVVVCGRNAPESPVGAFVECDVRDPESVTAMIERISQLTGRLDVVVNNAGGAPPSDAASASPSFSRKVIDLNLVSAIHVSQAAYGVMSQQAEGGSIINIASVSARRPSPGTAAYGAAKAGLISFTQSVAVEWAEHVRANAVVVGLVETELADLHYGGAEGVARVAATVPLGRMAKPEDVGNACLWLGSPLASYVSGATVELHGGDQWPAFLNAATTQ